VIQVCSQCATRWNVRDRQRTWCPRCNGTLLPPSAPEPRWSAQSVAPAQARPAQAGPAPSRLPAGYRWIAVRPGAPPTPRRRRTDLGPTPRYPVVPRWGLVDYFETTDPQQAPPREGPSVSMVRRTLIVTMAMLAAAALVHVVRYALLLINRSTLLNPILAGVVTWLGVAASVLALFSVVATALVLTNWLVARRSGAYAHRGQTDPRRAWVLRTLCLVPLVNLFWAPVFILELAGVEGRLSHLRRPIVTWWIVWVFSTALSLFSIATSFTSDAQGIADNTVATTIAYLAALAALVLVTQVFEGFERTPVERPAHRWVMVDDTSPTAQSAVPVEPDGQNPAA
jgi:hypothetical protein